MAQGPRPGHDPGAKIGLMQALLELGDPEGEALRAELWANTEIRPFVLRAVTRSSAGRMPIVVH